MKRRMNFLRGVILCLCLAGSNLAVAADSAEIEAERLLDVLNTKATMEQAILAMLDAQQSQNPTLAPYRPMMLQFFERYMSYESMKPVLAEIYATEFTADELAEIAEFFSSTVGKKYVSKVPTLLKQGVELGSKRVQDHLPELQKMIKAESERIHQQKEVPPASGE